MMTPPSLPLDPAFLPGLEEEWLEWYRLSPARRFQESEKLWAVYLSLGGSLDPEPDSQSPFDLLREGREGLADGRTGLHLVRRV